MRCVTFLLAVKRMSSNCLLTSSRNSWKRGRVRTNTCTKYYKISELISTFFIFAREIC